MNPAILLTGPPGVGKTTAIKTIIALLGDRAGGFYTREIRAQGRRTGFEIVTLEGHTVWLASRSQAATFKEEAQLGQYRVNLRGIDSFAVPALRRAETAGRVVIIDEIGPMEMASALFCQTVLDILAGPAAVVGTIALRPSPFAAGVRRLQRVQVITLTPDNRNQMPQQVLDRLLLN